MEKQQINKLLTEADELTNHFFGQNRNTTYGVTNILNTSNEAVILPEPSKQTSDESKIVATLKESGPV